MVEYMLSCGAAVFAASSLSIQSKGPEMSKHKAPEEKEQTLRERIAHLEAENEKLQAGEKALREQTRRQQDILDAVPSPVFFKDANGRYTGCNAAFAAMLGIEREALVGKSLYDVAPREVADRAHEVDCDLLSKGGKRSYETKVPDKDGGWGRFTVNKAVLADLAGEAAGLVGVMTDVTERRAAEDALRESEKTYRHLFENLNDAAFLADADTGMVLETNRQGEVLLGRPREEIVGMHQSQLHPPGQAEKYRRKFAEHVARGHAADHDSEVVRKDGTTVPVAVSAATVSIEGRRLILGLFRDITELKSTEQALREGERAERRFREMLTALHEVSNELTKIESFDEFCRQAVVLGRERLGFDRLGLWFRTDDPNRIRGSFGTDERGRLRDERALQIPVYPTTPFRQVLNRERPIFAEENVKLRNADGKPIACGSHAIAALWDGDNVIGCLCADNLLRGEVIGPYGCELLRLYAAALGHLCSRKRAEEALRQSEEKYRALTENTNDLVYSANAEGILTYVGPQVAHYGRSAEQAIGRNLLEFIIPEDRDRMAREFQESISTGREFPSQFRILGEGQAVHWVEDWGKVQRDESGKIVGITGILRDITDRKLAEQALRKSEARYRSLFEDSPISLWEEDFSEVKAHLAALHRSGVKDLRAYLDQHPEALRGCGKLVRTIDVNKATLDLYKAGTKEELMARMSEMFGHDARRMFKEELVCFDQGKRTCTAEGVTYSLQGDRIDVAIKWYLVPGASEDRVRLLVSVIDVTERKRAAEALQEVHRKLMTAREAERRRLARELHDSLGQQLIGLQLSLQGITADVAGGIGTTAADSLHRVADGVGELIHEVRTISHGLYPPTLESLGLAAALLQLVQDLPPSAQIEFKCPASLEKTRFSPEIEIALFRVGQEAVHNAIRHGRTEQIVIDLKRRKDRIVLTITDDGIGFDTAQAAGAGLGLTAMTERAEAAGGEVRIESRPGQTRVQARVPAEPAPGD